jgi:nicotinate-nucleotide adenylyltransferase
MKTGILGGTFNPVHMAHLAIAGEVKQAFQLDRVLFIPAAAPPHKDVAGEVSFEQRLAMVKLAVQDYPGFEVSDLEIRRQGKSYSVDTLEILKREDPGGELFFIIGLDSYRDIASWKDFGRIFSLCQLVVTARPGVEVSDPLAPLPVAMHSDFCYDETSKKIRHKSGHYVFFLSKTRLDISSTRIRELLNAGQSVNHLIPPAVSDYIKKHQLYCSTTHSRSQ